MKSLQMSFIVVENLENTLGEVIAHNGLTQLRIAETEKYPHVTFFLSGGGKRIRGRRADFNRFAESGNV